MEKDMDLEQWSLSDDLTEEEDISMQFQNHLNPSSSTEAQLLSGEETLRSHVKELPPGNSGVLSEAVTHSAASDYRDVPRERKAMATWTQLFKVPTGSQVPLDDGYSWRKYGQKDILGSKYPRGYYRCTHRHSQGCQATKQVQRSNDDPSIFEVIYRGRHTCEQSSSRLPQQIEAESEEKPEKSKMVSFGRILVTANFVLELPSAVFDQLSSIPKPLYAMTLMLLSFAGLVLCIVELVYQGRKKRVTWTRRQNNRNSSFSKIVDVVGFTCAVCQSILTTANYVLLIQHTKIQIQISVWPVIFAFVLLCSKFCDKTDESGRERSLRNEV
ncbi:hypothetical protein SLEP1_g9900 [Rubroshorea leprosula]|uniref:WRKY domain-containing protein n=1 Tax=Rubroshorea leprosula TaxID=152421 RepID=A0AAV5IEW3_9ROSI|nr:hypothetical protein SLEP1_g9900 [Rubroshorea leprosula]